MLRRVRKESEREYHQAVAGSAFTASAHDQNIVEQRRTSLGQVDAARRRLDEVRASRPGE